MPGTSENPNSTNGKPAKQTGGPFPPAKDFLHIKALDDHALATTLFHGADTKGPVVLINSGTAILRRFYRHFAEYLAIAGASLVITYDYRGIGDSWPGTDRDFQYLMSDWARLDFPAMMDWIGKNYSGHLIHVVGHSFGGQTLGLSDRSSRIAKMVTITAMSGHWREMAFPERYRVFAMLYMFSPFIARLYGHIPGKFGLGEDIASAAFKQWAEWCNKPDYFFNDPQLPETRYFKEFSGPILAVGLDDDPWGRPHLIDNLVNHFTAATIIRKQFSATEAGGAIGHFNFFKPKFRRTLWQPVADWLFEDKQLL